MADHVRLKVDKSQLLCKNGCGFFGNPEWDWYCSKCWRQHNTKQQHAYNFDAFNQTLGAVGLGSLGSSQSLPTPLNKERPSPFQSLIKKSPVAEASKKLSPQHSRGHNSLSQQFSKFEDKKRKHVQTLERKTSNMKQMFRKGKDEIVKARSPTRSDRPVLPPEAKTISKEFADYLSPRVKKAGIADLSRNIQSFIEKVHKRVEILPIDDVSVMVKNFYEALARRLEVHENFSGLSEEERSRICDLTERYIMVCCYKPLFCPFSSEDEDKDLEIQARIRSLNWVTAAHLECPFKETAPDVRDLIYLAINDILELDGSKAPQDKLASVVSCSKKIFTVLQAGDCAVASADDFLPSLIYILLKANPPRIMSNINFITRFSTEARLRSGEEGYYFTNLCCALHFVENLDAASLNLPQGEFDSYMSGEAIPPGSWEASLLMCEGIQTMSHNLKTLSDLSELQTKIMADMEVMEKDMMEFQFSVSAEVERVLARTTYTIREPKKPVTVDSLSPQTEERLLPSPLLPQNLSITPDTDTVARSSNLLEATPTDTLPPPLLPVVGVSPPPSDILPDTTTTTMASSSSPSLSTYIGFSAQSFSIPSISCNTAASDRLLSSPLPLQQSSASSLSPQPSPSSFTASSTSSSLHSVGLSPSSPIPDMSSLSVSTPEGAVGSESQSEGN
jgi:hypothetical protein